MSWRLIVRGDRRAVLDMCVEYVWERGHVVYSNIAARVARERKPVPDGTLTLECLLLACYYAMVISEEAHFDRILQYDRGLMAQLERAEHAWRRTLKRLFQRKLEEVSFMLADVSTIDLPPPWLWLFQMLPSFEHWRGFPKSGPNGESLASPEGRMALLQFIISRSKSFLTTRKRSAHYCQLFLTSLKHAFAAESKVDLFVQQQRQIPEDQSVPSLEESPEQLDNAEVIRYYKQRSSRESSRW